MPTKQEVQDYLKDNQHNSVLSASKHFRVEPWEIWKVIEQLQPAKSEMASCEKPSHDLEICKICIRNREGENKENFSPTKEKGSINHICEGYVNENNGSLFG